MDFLIRNKTSKKNDYEDCKKILNQHNENLEILSEGSYEWKIKSWSTLPNIIYSSNFTIGNHIWNLKLNKNYNDSDKNNDSISIYLNNMDINNDNKLCHIFTNFIFYIRNYHNSSNIYYGDTLFNYYDVNNSSCGSEPFIKRSDLFSKNNNLNSPLIEKDKCVIGVYVRIYRCDKEHFINEIKKCIIDDEHKILKEDSYEWEFESNYLNSFPRYSPEFTIANEKWRLELKNNNTNLYIYLENLNSITAHIKAKVIVYVRNYYDNSYYYYNDKYVNNINYYNNINASNYITSFKISEFNSKIENSSNKCLMEDNKLVFGVFMRIYRYENPLKMFVNSPEYIRRFKEKVRQLKQHESMKIQSGETLISLKRLNLFGEAYNNIGNKSLEELKKRLKIKYKGEIGIDAGGLLRDFFYNFSKEIGNPNYSLFQYSHEDSYELEINPKSGIFEPDHLKYFKFVGRIMGLAVFHNQQLPLPLTIIFYKKFLNKPLEFIDLELADPELYKNILWLKDNEGVENLNLTFEIEEVDCFNNRETIELKPNGSNIDVNDNNKYEYISLLVNHKLNYLNAKEQFQAIREGFYEIIPEDIISSFDEFDLKFLISGINEIDIDDWEENTVYENYNKYDITIINFWKCVREFSEENRTRLLLFTTGTTQVPVTGFKDLQGNGKTEQFKIKRIESNKNLPISHTCFNRIDLPSYTSYTQLKEKLLIAIHEGIGSFEMD